MRTTPDLVINSPVYDDYAKFAFTWPWCFQFEQSHSLDFFLSTDWTTEQLFLAYAEAGRPTSVVFANESVTKSGEYGTIIYDTWVEDTQIRVNLYYNTRPGNESLYWRLFGELRTNLDEHRQWLVSLMPPPPLPEEKISVTFTYSNDGDVAEKRRNIDACEWTEIRGNYSGSAVNDLESLVSLAPEDLHGGKLAVLYGPPGTGKTHLIRALARSWKSWANITYIVDVDRFFASAGYMLDVLMSETDNKWKVIICEDAEEYISPESKKTVGQALSRLLNVGDGLVGQGLRVIFIFTTNAFTAALHPAITRAGRCFAKIEIPLLSRWEAAQWLGGDAGSNLPDGTSLADLYELRKKTKIEFVSEKEPVGQYL